MDLDNSFPLFAEGFGWWFLFLGALAGAAVMRWAGKRYDRTCRQRGTALAACGLTGELVAQRLLVACGLGDVAVRRSGQRNFYHPRKREIHLTTINFDSPSLLALTIAAHEVGHAQQFAERTLLCRLRGVFWPACFLLLGLVVALPLLHLLGVVDVSFPLGPFMLTLGVVILVLQLAIHLPLERDASRRAHQLVQETGLLHAEEQPGLTAMLRAAWWTHAARHVQGALALVVVAAMLVCCPQTLGEAAAEETAAIQEAAGEVGPAVVNLPPGFHADVAAELGEGPSALGATFYLLSGMFGLAPCLLLWLVLGKLGPGVRPSKSPAERAIERNNAGLECHRKGAYAAALEEFAEALRLDPNLAVVYYNRGQTYLHVDRLDEALADFDANLQRTPGYTYAVAARGEVWTRRGQLDRALTEYEEAVRLAPENSCLLSMRGFARLRGGDLAGASADFESALHVNPKEALAHRGRGMLGIARSDRDQALIGLSQALALGDEDAMIYQLRGQVWLYNHDLDRALADFTEALRRDPRQAAALRDRGLVWFFKNEPERALDDLNAALAENPTDAVAFNNRGAVLLRVGAYTRAQADLQESIRLDPSFPNPYKHLAWLQATCPEAAFRDGAAAVANAARALELTEGKAVEWYPILAAAHAEAGQFDEAIAWQTKYQAAAPANAQAEGAERLALYQAHQAYREQPIPRRID